MTILNNILNKNAFFKLNLLKNNRTRNVFKVCKYRGSLNNILHRTIQKHLKIKICLKLRLVTTDSNNIH